MFPVSLGTPGSPPSVIITNQVSLIAFLPAGGTPNKLCGNASPAPCPGDLVISTASQVPDPSGSGSKGYGAGVLAGQTLALTLGVKLSGVGATPPGLGNLSLTNTCHCGGGGHAFTLSSCILNNASTVNQLLALANQALRGINLALIDPCLTYSGISDALAAINEGLDECAQVCSCN